MSCTIHVVAQARVDDLAPTLFDALGRYLRAVQLRLPTEAEGVGGVTKEQWGVLADLGRAGATGLSMGELAGRRGMSLTSATALVDRLVHAGLVARRHDEADRRVVRVQLTADGARLRSAVARVRLSEYERLLAELTPEERSRLEAAVPALERLAEVTARGGAR